MWLLAGIIIGLILLFGWVFIGSAISVNKKYWKYYSPIYKTLNKDDWELTPSGNAWWIWKADEFEPVKMQWFGSGAIMLKPHVFIHDLSNSFVYLDPYTLYWHWKYNHWFKKNLLNK